MYGTTEVILFPIGGKDVRTREERPKTATARVVWGSAPSRSMSVARRLAARRNNELISQLNIQARLETEEEGWYR